MNRFLTSGEAFSCCGCRACEQICPTKCISISTDSEGFIIPKIDSEICIGCNACSKVCPIENPEEGNMPLKIYATASADLNTILKSSSGGIFYLLAKNIINQGGFVVGASLDLEKRYLQHSIVNSMERLYSLLGSKYIASDTRTTFSEVKTLLSNGRKVLYIGTPCQIAGLRKYIKNDNPYLYTCDLLCHGVPSRYVFEQYINYLERKHKGKVVNLNFRDKEKYGWSITLRYDINRRGKVRKFCTPAGLSPYFYGFLRGKFLRESCYYCPYTKLQRMGDLTLADFWGAKELNLTDDLNTGCSCVLVNTDKGKEILGAVNSELQFKHQVTYEQAYRQNVNFKEPCKRPIDRDYAIRDIGDYSFDYVARKYCNNPRKTRIRLKLLLRTMRLYKNF